MEKTYDNLHGDINVSVSMSGLVPGGSWTAWLHSWSRKPGLHIGNQEKHAIQWIAQEDQGK